MLDSDKVDIDPGESVEIGFRYAYGRSRYSSLMAFRVASSSGEENVAVAYTMLNSFRARPKKEEAAVVAKGDEDKKEEEEKVNNN